MIAFFVVVLVVVVGIHLYLWKRLVRDTMRPGPWRKAGGFVILSLALVMVANLVLSRTVEWKALAWPGYLWIALMFYLLVALLVLEIPRLVVARIWRANGRDRSGTETVHAARAEALPDRSTSTTPQRSDTDPAAKPATESAAAAVTTKPATRLATGTGNPATRTADDPATGAGDANEAGEAIRPDGDRGQTDGPNGGRGETVRTDWGRGGTAAVDDGRGGTAGTDDGRGETDGADGGRGEADGRRGETDGADGGRGEADGGRGETDGADGGRGGIERRLLLARGAAIFAGLTAASVTGFGVRTALGGPQLDRVQIPVAKLPRAMDGTRLAVVSDIHLGPLTGADHLKRIVSMINSVDADVVCIVGDFVDGSVAELGEDAAALRDIRSRHGAYFVTGNHEYYSGFQEWVDEVGRLGVRPLRNQRLEIVTRGGAFDLAGVNDLGGAQFGDGPDFQAALGDRDTSRPVVLMAHQPAVAHDAARFGVDLQVSGHTHGGQMVPFNYLVGLEQPVVSGYGNVDGVPVYVTNGAGFWGPPVRVGAPPQVTLVEMRST